MLQTLEMDDVYKFSLVVDPGAFLERMSGAIGDNGFTIQEPGVTAHLAAGFFSWLSSFLQEAQVNGWELAELGMDAISFDKVIATRELEAVLAWFPFDGEAFVISLIGKGDYQEVERQGQSWVVQMSTKQLNAARR